MGQQPDQSDAAIGETKGWHSMVVSQYKSPRGGSVGQRSQWGNVEAFSDVSGGGR